MKVLYNLLAETKYHNKSIEANAINKAQNRNNGDMFPTPAV